MDELDADAAKRPLLFPDPVIEFYLEKVDRAAIRARLGKTPAERLQSLVEQAACHENRLQSCIGEEPEPTRQGHPDQSKKFAGFITYTPDPDPAKRPLLFPDPVVEAYLKDVDRGLIREQLKLTPTQRLRCLERMAEFYEEGRKLRARERQQRQHGHASR